jgi:hypothetical protein
MTPLKNNGLIDTISILDKKDKLDKTVGTVLMVFFSWLLVTRYLDTY